MAKPTYIGFSTVGKLKPPFTLTDQDLIKQDLLNQFNTMLGERVLLPNYGTNIPKYVSEPLDDITTRNINEEAIRIINSEPRVNLVSVVPVAIGDTVRIEIQILYVPSNQPDTLYITYKKEGY